ncbi:hypothetical protein CALVIDRAFT_190612 [Calocera viscosa TUFC12733]|uniref:Uncharacterized protein n=1 Tax=Calocera viscosa (strain TUFC12733) TaxID=1330018 RepID=A0A167KMM2_CALVF|nr:hypothetical protein CALVIDRAFT_190612 [Calocera viscosa TUFC12733]
MAQSRTRRKRRKRTMTANPTTTQTTASARTRPAAGTRTTPATRGGTRRAHGAYWTGSAQGGTSARRRSASSTGSAGTEGYTREALELVLQVYPAPQPALPRSRPRLTHHHYNDLRIAFSPIHLLHPLHSITLYHPSQWQRSQGLAALFFGLTLQIFFFSSPASVSFEAGTGCCSCIGDKPKCMRYCRSGRKSKLNKFYAVSAV